MKSFWTHPNATRYERLIRDSVNHVGRTEAFQHIEEFYYTFASGYTTLSHDNIDVLMSCRDDVLCIIIWAKIHDYDGTIDTETKLVYTLSDYPIIQELAQHMEKIHTHTPTQKG